MSPNDTNIGARGAAATRRHSTALVVAAGLAGLLLGAIAAFAITSLVWTVRVELPPPLSSNMPPGCVYPIPAAPSAIPAPPMPPPHALRPPLPQI